MKSMNRLKRLVREPVLLLSMALVVACLALFVVYPILRVFLFPTLKDFLEIPGTPRYLKALLNSLFVTALSTTSATLFGFLYAYAVTRTNVPLKRVFRFISILPLFSPPFMVAFSYMMMFGKNGLVSHQLLGLNMNIFGWHGLWLCQTIAFFPAACLVMEGVLQSIAPSLEYAGRNLGATGFRLFRTITLPLAIPGIAGAALLTSIQVLADFGNPIMIAGDFSVLATEAWLRVEGWGDVRGAAVLSSILLLPSLLLFFVQRYWVGRRSYVTITGKIALVDIRKTAWGVRWLLFGFCTLVSTMILLVYAGLFIGSFVQGWGFDWTPTLRYVQEIFSRSPELVNSLTFALVAGLVSAVFSLTAAYLVTRKRFLFRRFVDFTSILPAALPGIFFGIGYSIAFTRKPFDLYGTAAIIILSMIFWNISMGYQTGIGTFSQISPSFSEAASNLGAGSARIFWQIEAPLVQGPFFSAFVVSFIRAATTLSVIVFLSTSRNGVATFSIMNLVNDGFYGHAAALTSALLVITFSVLGLARLVIGKRLELFKV
jgi:iron(III) transport system permease protein